MRLSGTVAVITGASGGIGAAMARRFAAEGVAGLCLADIAEPALTELVADLRKAAGSGLRVLATPTDVADETQVQAMIDRTIAELGPIDLFCSNAGVATGQGLEAPDDVWARTWSVNVLAHVYAARAVVPHMLARGGGYLLNTCSAAGLLTQPGDAPYAVTKNAAVAFAEWLAVTYGDQGIKVSALCPQGVRTAMLDSGLGESHEAARVVAAAGKVLAPEEVADAVVTGLAAERFLILPHPEVAEYARRKGADRDRWLAGIRRLVASLHG
ncbi:MAG TPA: SDR family oxidoreductase [Streptosporangiaceae bacterium]|nr:SDR family oxidoreductase [Streptosporangiaceae bacterium]